ncbi:MAG TPA: ROK family protein [Acidimicrobiia bacterium]|nr:ROK family protein [Acidimicrobiia bacterium]
MTTTIGIDIGGSSTTAIAIDHEGQIFGRHHVSGGVDGGRQIVSAALAAVSVFGVDDFDAVGVGVPGQVDPVTGQVRMAVNLGIGSGPLDLGAELEDALGVPVTLENDVHAAAVGAHEALRLNGGAPDTLALVSIGTGIGAGVVLHGEVLRGAHGMAGEIGHVVVDESGPVCRCGQRGCLEAVAAGPSIARAWPRGAAGSAATALFGAAAEGDAAAQKVAGRIAGHLTTALIWLSATHDSEMIVLAGGVSTAGQPFLEAVREQVERRGLASELAARRLRPEQVVLARVDDAPGALGAAVLAARLIERRESPAASKERQ